MPQLYTSDFSKENNELIDNHSALGDVWSMGNFGVLLPAGNDIGIDDGIPPQEWEEEFPNW
jgi:hypothetical protein